MTHTSAAKCNGGRNFKGTALRGNHSGITDLAAHCRIEGSPSGNNGSFLAFRKNLHKFPVVFLIHLRGEHQNRTFIRQGIISGKFCCNIPVDIIIDSRNRSHIVLGLPGFPCAFPLLLHAGGKPLFVHGVSLFHQDILCQIQRETVGVIQFKRLHAGKAFFSLRIQFFLKIIQNTQSLIDGAPECLLFFFQDTVDKRFPLFQFRVSLHRSICNCFRKVRKEQSFDPETASVAGSTADESAQHIAAAFIGRHNAIGDHKGG